MRHRLTELWLDYGDLEDWPEGARAERETLLEASAAEAERRTRRKARRIAAGGTWAEPAPAGRGTLHDTGHADDCPCRFCMGLDISPTTA